MTEQLKMILTNYHSFNRKNKISNIEIFEACFIKRKIERNILKGDSKK